MESALTLAIIGHLVGDYLLQNDWMALQKKKRLWPCFVHCALWMNSVMFFSGWYQLPFLNALLVGLVLFWTHFAQDHTNIIVWWMRLIGQERFMRSDDFDCTDFRVIPGLGPWSIIVVDNVWHIVTLWAVWKFLA